MSVRVRTLNLVGCLIFLCNLNSVAAPVEQRHAAVVQTPEQLQQQALGAPNTMSLGDIIFSHAMSSEALLRWLQACSCEVIALDGHLSLGSRSLLICMHNLHRYRGSVVERVRFFEQHNRLYLSDMNGHIEQLKRRFVSPGVRPVRVIGDSEGQFAYRRVVLAARNAQWSTLSGNAKVGQIRLYSQAHAAGILQALAAGGDRIPLDRQVLPGGKASLQPVMPVQVSIPGVEMPELYQGTDVADTTPSITE